MNQPKPSHHPNPDSSPVENQQDTSQPDQQRTQSQAQDFAWVRAFQQDDTTAFENLVRKYEKRVYRHCLRLCRDESESLDLSQEVFIKAYRNLGRYRPQYAFYTWLYRITVNCCIDHARRKKRVPHVSLQQDDNGSETDIADQKQLADDRLQQDQSRQQIQAALNKLPKHMRIIMLLKEWEGLSYEEIAEIMNCSRGTVKSRIFRAREQLRTMLKNVQMP